MSDANEGPRTGAEDTRSEASPISHIVTDEGAVVGTVYLWNTMELSVLWVARQEANGKLRPRIRSETMERSYHSTNRETWAMIKEMNQS